MREFDTGATRDKDDHKYDYEGFLSPLVLRAFGEYMHRHRVQPDGNLRDSDNWQKGMPLNAYMKSLWRHFMDVWMLHRGQKVLDYDGNDVTLKESLLAVLFNTMGYLHELLQKERWVVQSVDLVESREKSAAFERDTLRLKSAGKRKRVCSCTGYCDGKGTCACFTVDV